MAQTSRSDDINDLFVIGGGINGCGIARDAAGRGLSVVLAEKDDLASATSSASTKLFHGGLRYLEYFELRLVREALIEREILLRAMPHISWPMRFVLPYHKEMRFDGQTPASRILGFFMPWLRGRRPAWMVRFGLWLYDHLGGRAILPGTSSLRLKGTKEGAPLQDKYQRAFEYSDCWIDDARLVVLNARDAARRGAQILTRAKVISAHRHDQYWTINVEDQNDQQTSTYKARMIVNAAGPWVEQTLRTTLGTNSADSVRLVRGSHIVTPRLFDHDKCYFFQGRDGRIIFAIPYEDDFTLIGTTDQDHPDPAQPPVCTEQEQDYLCQFASEYFKKPVTRDDIVWTYSGVRPLHDDGAGSASAATRDYTLKLDREGGAPLLNVFGGKITTYRRLAESALDKIAKVFPDIPGKWTAGVPLPGGDFEVDGVAQLKERLCSDFPFLGDRTISRLIRSYGTDAWKVIGDARSIEDMGQDFGGGLSAREVSWLIETEYAQSAHDILWRRSKLGLRFPPEQHDVLQQHIEQVLKTHRKEANGQG